MLRADKPMMVDENSRHGMLGEGPAVKDLETTPPETLTPSAGPEDPFARLLEAVRPGVNRLFRRFWIPAEVAETFLEETLLVLLYRYDELARPEAWLLRTLRNRCVRFRHKEREQAVKLVDKEIRNWLDDTEAPLLERQRRYAVLERKIDQVPRRCRPLLRRHYGFAIRLEDAGMEPAVRRDLLPFPQPDPQVRCLAALIRHLTELEADA